MWPSNHFFNLAVSRNGVHSNNGYLIGKMMVNYGYNRGALCSNATILMEQYLNGAWTLAAVLLLKPNCQETLSIPDTIVSRQSEVRGEALYIFILYCPLVN